MKIPVKISPFFFVIAALIGWGSSASSSQPFLFTLLWVGVIFVSVLVHEYGHALASYTFGQKPHIHLVAFGGLMYPGDKELRGWREFIVVLSGPLFGFLLFLFSFLLLSSQLFANFYIIKTLTIFVNVNFVWTVINLLPALPLDGGHLLRTILEALFKAKGTKYALFASMIFSSLLGLAFFVVGSLLIGALFCLFAFNNFTSWKQLRPATENDRSAEVIQEMKEIESLLERGQKEGAVSRLVEALKKWKEGTSYNRAAHYLAALLAEKGEYQGVYDLLLPIEKHLDSRAKLYLHTAAYEVGDYPLVAKLGPTCFQSFPDPEIALRIAKACATLSKVEPALGWLQAARRGGVEHFADVLSSEAFDPIRGAEGFKKLVESAQKR